MDRGVILLEDEVVAYQNVRVCKHLVCKDGLVPYSVQAAFNLVRPSILCRLPTPLNAIEPHTSTFAACLTVCRQHSEANSSPRRRHTYRQPSFLKLILDSSLKRTVFQSSSVHARWTATHSRRRRRCLGVRRGF